MDRFYLKRNLPIFETGNTISIGTGNKYVEFEKNDRLINVLKQLTSDGLTPQELEGEFDLFSSGGFLTKDLDNDEDLRNNLYLEMFGIKPLTKEILKRKILVFGAGAGGSITTFLLSQWGFNNICVVDFDIVEFSDIKKTTIYRAEHIGMSKNAALSEIIANNFGTHVTTHNKCIGSKQDITSIIDQVQPEFIVYAIDPKPEIKFFLNDVCFAKKIPFLIIAYSNQYIRLGPLCIPGKTRCLESFKAFLREKNFDIEKAKQLFKHYYLHPSVSFNVSILGGLVLKEIIFYFANNLEMVKSYNKIITFDPLTLTSSEVVLDCKTDCATCQT